MQRVIATVKREDEVQGRDLELPAEVKSCKLADLIAQALQWSEQHILYKVEAHPPGRVLRPDETLADAGAWDGSSLFLYPSPEESAFPDAIVFLVVHGSETWFRLPSTSVVVGRTDPGTGNRPDIDLAAQDPRRSVSRKHARIFTREGIYYIEDLHSRNGVYVNHSGAPLSHNCPTQLSDGDVIGLGAVDLTFRIEQLD